MSVVVVPVPDVAAPAPPAADGSLVADGAGVGVDVGSGVVGVLVVGSLVGSLEAEVDGSALVFEDGAADGALDGLLVPLERPSLTWVMVVP